MQIPIFFTPEERRSISSLCRVVMPTHILAMRSNLRFLGLLLVCSLAPSLSSAAIQHVKMPTHTLADSNRVIVATPRNFDSERRGGYPFVIMLHGWSGDETQWEDDADLQFLADSFGVLLVLPDGGYDGWWMDNGRTAGRNYDSYLRQDLKPWIIKRYNGSAKKLQQGIMGLSMGGYGAVMQALKYPDQYAAAASLSGVMDITRHPDSWGIEKTLGPYQDDQAGWQTHNPLDLTQQPPRQNSPPLLLICGRDDFAFAENQTLVHQLDRLDYSYVFREAEGAHSHVFWKTHVNSAIAFIVAHMQR